MPPSGVSGQEGHHFGRRLILQGTVLPRLTYSRFSVQKTGELQTFSILRWNGRFHECSTYRYLNRLPRNGGETALQVNWVELTLTRTDTGEVLYQNAFITDFPLTGANVPQIVQAGRSRWKVENENTNVLKTKGYHLEHNYGHGRQLLSTT